MAGERLSAARIGLKRLLKTLLGPFGLPFTLLRPVRAPRVLLYHRVNAHPFAQLGPVSRELTVRPADFRWQLRHLARRGFRIVDAATFHAMLRGALAPDPRAVLITFDDGYEDNLTEALPILSAAAAPAVVFVVSGFVGRETGQVWPHGDAPGCGRFLTAAQVTELARSGIEIGSHTLAHPRMTGLSDAALRRELLASRAALEAMTGRPVRLFAYPEGDVDDRVEQATGAAGYSVAFTTVTGAALADGAPLRVRRTEVSASDSRFVFSLKLSGALDWTRFKDGGAVRRLVASVNDFALARLGAAR